MSQQSGIRQSNSIDSDGSSTPNLSHRFHQNIQADDPRPDMKNFSFREWNLFSPCREEYQQLLRCVDSVEAAALLLEDPTGNSMVRYCLPQYKPYKICTWRNPQYFRYSWMPFKVTRSFLDDFAASTKANEDEAERKGLTYEDLMKAKLRRSIELDYLHRSHNNEKTNGMSVYSEKAGTAHPHGIPEIPSKQAFCETDGQRTSLTRKSLT